MRTIKVKITGTTALMVNNPQTVNPMNIYTKQLKEFTSKRNKSDEDQEVIFRLHFLASLYQNNRGQYIVPANMILASFMSGAKENKLGAKFARSCQVLEDAVLEFPHKNCTPDELYDEHGDLYVDIRPVGIMKSKVATARAIFPEWSFITEICFDETQFNDSEIWLAIRNAGLRYGIGTYRQLFGRYTAEEVKDDATTTSKAKTKKITKKTK